MSTSRHTPPVITYLGRQFRTGREVSGTTWLPDAVYSQALDALVIACVDVVPVYRGRILIGHRTWQPQADWWIFGGRMHKSEWYQQAAARNTRRELFSGRGDYEFELDRFRALAVYNLIWDQRAQEPLDAGCHLISVTTTIRLTRQEVHDITPNEEYSEVKWIHPQAIIANSDTYHPCLVQIARDILGAPPQTP